ncbi:MAG: DUF4173 domain-containing protein [Clostridia bacterium]|nr:DUF4173 domain-containing protein [Clostridia bacterium]
MDQFQPSFSAPTAPPVSLEPERHMRDTVFAYLTIPVCFLLVKVLLATERGLGATLAILLALAFSALYLRLSGVRLTVRAYVTGILLALFSFGSLTNDNAFLRGLLFLVLCVLLPFFIYTCCTKRENSLLRAFWGHAAHSFRIPFDSIKISFPCFLFKKGDKPSRALSILGWCALGLFVAIFPTLIIGLLLSYDTQFTALLDRIFDFSFDHVFENLRDIILACALSIPLFGALFGNLQRTKQNTNTAKTEIASDRMHILPKPLLCAFVTPILLLYVLFFISQWNYYVSAFTNTLPQDLTYAEYAREGFFQLCTVCVINALILVIFQTMMRRRDGERELVRRVYTAIISLFTLVLIATALSKMVLYMDAYGMTLKRVYATWMILFLALVFLLTVISSCWRKFPFFKCAFAATVLSLSVLFLVNFGTTVANYNVDAYQKGKLSTVDVEALESLGDSAIPALVRLEDLLEEKASSDKNAAILLEQASTTLDRLQEARKTQERGVMDLTIPNLLADRALQKR